MRLSESDSTFSIPTVHTKYIHVLSTKYSTVCIVRISCTYICVKNTYILMYIHTVYHVAVSSVSLSSQAQMLSSFMGPFGQFPVVPASGKPKESRYVSKLT